MSTSNTPEPIAFPSMARDATVTRLKTAQKDAESNMRMFANDDPGTARYYSGVADGLIRAIEILEAE